MFNLSTFVNTGLINVIKVNIINFLVLRYKLYIIKKIFIKINKKNIINFLLKNVIVIKGFYINIILKSRLKKVKI
jgi:hypothetical protein